MIDYSIGVVPAPFVMPRLGEWLHDKLGFWSVLSGTQKVAVISAVLLAIALPVVVRTSLQQTRTRPSASVLPETPPETPPDVTPTVTPTPTPTGRYITVIDPNGGEMLIVGQTYRIRWASSTTIDKVWIGYTTGPGSLNWIVTNYPNSGFYDWTVFVGNTLNTQFRIDLTGYQTGVGSAHDQSDDFFTVLRTLPTPTSTPTVTPTPTPTSTPTPTPTPAMTTLYPIADTYVSSEEPSKNFGLNPLLKVDGEPILVAYLKFDLTTLANSTILSAKLRYRVTNSSLSTQVFKRVEDVSWRETTTTYQNRPALSGVVASRSRSIRGRFVTVDVTSAVREKIGGLMSLGIDSTGRDGLDFRSREFKVAYRPQLVITYR